MVLPPSRSAREALARQLRERGLRLREIADELGVAISTVDSWLNDPGGERLRARKDSYRGRCERCGAATDGSGGRAQAPRLCSHCFRSQPHSLERAQRLGRGASSRRYSDRELLDAVRRADRLGLRTAPGYARHAGERQLPSMATLIHRFGSWNHARAQAGLPTRASNRREYERIETGRCLEAVAAVWGARGEPPTFHGYDVARRAGDPCAATIRTRCGSWTTALQMASGLVVGTGDELAAAA
jgi:predicted transcriptional regulator